jgi:hypothetical protein
MRARQAAPALRPGFAWSPQDPMDDSQTPQPPALSLEELLRAPETPQESSEDPGAKPTWVNGRRKDRVRASDLRAQADAAKGAAMALDWAAGKSLLDIAKKYHVTQATAKKRITAMEKAGLFTFFEENILEHLVPKALAVYEKALDRGELAAARDILHGTNILRKDGKQPAEAARDAVANLDDYRRLRAEGVLEAAGKPN